MYGCMRSYLFLPSIILLTVLWYMPTSSDLVAEQAAHDTLHDSQNQLVKITDSGISEATLRMKKEDRIVFFLNDTTDSLITITLAFGSLRTHCTSENLAIEEGGTIRSSQPIVPKDFASTCFHDEGSYPYTVYGLKNFPEGIKGTIIIE
jgi:hypothetical protein